MAAAPIESLRPDTPLQPLYIIHGEEDLLRIEALDTLRAAAKKQGYLNREVYTAENNFDWNELLQSAGSAGLFADLNCWKSTFPTANPAKTEAMPCKLSPNACPKIRLRLSSYPSLKKRKSSLNGFPHWQAKASS